MNRHIELSKIMSHALRHEPDKYNIKLDDQGWIDIDRLIYGIRLRNLKYNEININDIVEATYGSGKTRHEIKDGFIRARYGHSVDLDLELKAIVPPAILYHGTLSSNLGSIKLHGLVKGERCFVHLSNNSQDAVQVAKRRQGGISVIKILALDAFSNDIIFHNVGTVWLVKHLPPKYLSC